MAAYAFQAQPRAVTNRPKYRDEDTHPAKTLIQSDPRVFRGSTVAPHRVSAEAEAPQRRVRRGKPKESDPSPFALPLPPPDRIPVDLDVHLIAPEKVIAVTQSDSQTDTFLPEPPEPEYVPKKTGLDATTQIYEGDLFVFDIEVAPILDVLTTKTLEQALTEVAEETELANVTQFKQEWQKRQAALMEDWEKTVEVERKRAAEKQKVLAAAKEKKQRELALMEKLACARLAAEYTRGVVPTTIRSLIEAGQFPESARQPLMSDFWPWLFEEVHKKHDQMRAADEIVTEMVQKVSTDVNRRNNKINAELTRKLSKQKRVDNEKSDALRGKIRIHLNTAKGAVVIGPITVSSTEEIAVVNERTYVWLQENHPDVAATAPWGVELYIGDAPAEHGAQLFTAEPGKISLKPCPEPVKEEEPPPEAPAEEEAQ